MILAGGPLRTSPALRNNRLYMLIAFKGAVKEKNHTGEWTSLVFQVFIPNDKFALNSYDV